MRDEDGIFLLFFFAVFFLASSFTLACHVAASIGRSASRSPSQFTLESKGEGTS